MGTETKSEQILLRESLSGNKEAFGVIIERYRSLVCAITYSSTGDLAKSEDLAQEAFVRAWKELGRLKDLGKFRAWLSTITRNLVRKSFKKKQTDVVWNSRSLEDAEQAVSSEPGPVETSISKEQEVFVWAALKDIPPQFREPMILYYREQRSIRQVAVGLGLSEDAVRQRLSRGRKLLKVEVASLVENVIGRTAPSKTFAIAVVAALPAVAPQAVSAAIAGMAAKGSVAAKSAGLIGLVGAALGPLLGLLGSVVSIKASIANTKSPREHAFMRNRAWLAILYSVGSGAVILMILWWIIPRTGYGGWLIFSGCVIYLSGIFTMAFLTERRRKAIQIEDGTYVKPQQRLQERTKNQIYGSFGGAIFGSLLWLHLMSVQAKDWITLWSVLLIGILIFWVTTRICLRAKQHYDRIAMIMFGAVGLLYLTVVNLRWYRWMEVLGQHSKYRNLSLRQMNIIILAVIGLLLIIFLIIELQQHMTIKRKNGSHKEFNENR